jgi:leucyl-tRNA synthetase
LTIPVGAEKDSVLELAKADEKVKASIEGKNLLKQIYVPNKLVNFVAK